MKRITILLVVSVLPFIVFGQENIFEYTPKVKKRIEVYNLLGEIDLKNSTGNAITIESDFNLNKPERAEGLQLLGISEDNTGLGVNIIEEDGIVKIIGVTKKVKDYTYKISVPDGIAVSIDYDSPFASGELKISSYNGSIEVKTLSANVKITDCTGPFTVNSISGDIEAVFSSFNQGQPSSLASVSGLVDVSLPANTKADIIISNVTGDIYNNLGLVSLAGSQDGKRSKGLKKYKNSSKSEYTLNGGGQKLLLETISGNIYLRKN